MRGGDVTWATGEELDEPSVEANAVRGGEPDVLVCEPQARRCEGVGLCEARQHWNVNQLLLERNQQAHPRHHQPSNPVQQDAHVRHHSILLLLLLDNDVVVFVLCLVWLVFVEFFFGFVIWEL